jgi:hypothetical protein
MLLPVLYLPKIVLQDVVTAVFINSHICVGLLKTDICPIIQTSVAHKLKFFFDFIFLCLECIFVFIFM